MRRYSPTELLLVAGIAGPVLFVVVSTVDGATRTGYDPAYHPISALSLGDRGWLQITNFIVSGLLVTAFAVGLRRHWRPGPGARWGPALVGTFGIGLVLSGVFVMDPMRGYPPGAVTGDPATFSWHHTLHDLFGMVVFLSLPLACFVAARRFAARPGRRGRAGYSVLSGVAGLVLMGFFGTAWETDDALTGVVQRVMIVVDWLWLVLLASWLVADARRARDADPDVLRAADQGREGSKTDRG
ncbi:MULTISPECIES: DUF998 domain-containing protein [Polymorphospora]|uniref:DUF998 domain-containing protein n=1 Tax=Polymorphospora lycopeni TaxID=3140240 RepID=A0ABV5D0R5_9ACTN